MMKKGIGTLMIASALLMTAGTASAHVTVWPKESTAGAYEKYTVRVPVEKELNTTKVRVEFPAGTKIGTVMPMPGWDYQFDKNSEGVFTAITWTAAAGGGIKPHEFVEFNLSGKNPDAAGTIAWKAYQTYSDGSVVEWTGDKDSKTPASVTTMKPKADAGTDDHHDDTKTDTNKDTTESKQEATPATTTSSSNTLPMILSGAALLLALISLFRKRA